MGAVSRDMARRLELQVDAANEHEALVRAMRFRDAVGMAVDVSATLDGLPFDFHLHHPWGC